MRSQKEGNIKIVILIIAALISIGQIACESKPNKQNVATSSPKIDVPKPPAEPYSFKNFKLGMTLTEFNNLKPIVTYKIDQKFAAVRFIDTTIGGSKGDAQFRFEDYGKGLQLTRLSITIPKTDFSIVKDVLISKYGTPTSTSNITKSNAMGATFNGEKLIWNNGTSEIEAESIGNKIDQAIIRFYHLNLGKSKQDQEDSAKAKGDI